MCPWKYGGMYGMITPLFVVCLSIRVGAQLGLQQMMTIEIKIPNRMVGLGRLYDKRGGKGGERGLRLSYL